MINIEVSGNNAIVSADGEKEISLSELAMGTISGFYVITKNSGIKEKKQLMKQLIKLIKSGIMNGNNSLID